MPNTNTSTTPRARSWAEVPRRIKQRYTLRQEGGDDGYQYAVRYRGQLLITGCVRREAEHHRLQHAIGVCAAEATLEQAGRR